MKREKHTPKNKEKRGGENFYEVEKTEIGQKSDFRLLL